MAEPIIAYDLLYGMMILKNGCAILASRCIVDIKLEVVLDAGTTRYDGIDSDNHISII